MFIPRIFKVAAFVADVPDIFVSGVDLFNCLSDWNVVISSVLDKVFSGMKIPDSPRSDNLDSRSECVDGSFETYLVITLTCTAVADVECLFFFSDFYKFLGHKRSCH